MPRHLVSIILSVIAVAVNAQVTFTKSMEQTAPDEITISFCGTMEKGWHVYAPNVTNGPIPASFNVDEIEGAEKIGGLKANKAATTVYEEIFGGNVGYYENSVTFMQRIKLTGKRYKVKGYFQFGACNESSCLPPTDVEFDYEGNGVVSENDAKDHDDDTDAELLTKDSVTNSPTKEDNDTVADIKLWESVTDQLAAYSNDVTGAPPLYDTWGIFLMGLLGGFIALLTPCVWPIIPMTVSFFIKRSKHGVRDAILYGVSIIVIYLTLGLAVTALFGASALNALSTNAIVNIFFFLLLVVFGVSFLGAFELTLPSSWSNAVDAKATSATGLLSIFLMAITLVLVSFSCTAPIVGFLLVEMVDSTGSPAIGNLLSPAVGMFGFSLALALPFTLFAIFPTWMKSLPKSGAWMKDIKVVLGVIELAFSLKFLSVADMAYGWGILSRDIFLALWIILFAGLGVYMIRRCVKERRSAHPSFKGALGLLVCGGISIAFALYMVPGLWGAPCKAVSAFAPPMSTQHIRLYKSEPIEAQFTDFDKGMAYASKVGKPVMIDFTGFGCVNCRKMEAAVFTDETVKNIIEKDYVFIQLYVDDKTQLPKPITVIEHGAMVTLRTIGDRWSYLQRIKFGCNTQPFYVLLDNDGNPLNGPYSYDEDIGEFLSFLKTGLKNYKK